MDPIAFDEIISILAMHGRPDLIDEFKNNIQVDPDYKPPTFMMRDSLSCSEGSATSEEEYKVEVDDEGFYSLE